jgi:hypothetical protein
MQSSKLAADLLNLLGRAGRYVRLQIRFELNRARNEQSRACRNAGKVFALRGVGWGG